MNQVKMMIVDDNPDNIELLKYKLELSDKKYQIIKATSGKKALELLTNNKPDIILLDIMMPEMDGFEVATKIKSTYANEFIPIIMITAREDLDSKIKGLKSGGDDYIIKPFEISELEARINALLRINELQIKVKNINSKLVEAEKLAAVGATVATLNHEINNPLCAILLDIQMIIMSNEFNNVSDQLQKKIVKIEKSAKRISEITQKLSKLEELSTKEYLEGAHLIDIE